MANLNKQELRRLAQCASTGPWKAEMEGGRMNVASEDWYLLEMHHDQPLFMTDAAFIAAANPATILALLDELERLENDNRSKNGSMKAFGEQIAKLQRAVKNRDKRLEKAEAENDGLRLQCGGMQMEIDELKAGLEACKRGRPLDLARFDFGGPIGAVSDVVMGVGIGALLEPAKDDGEGSVNG